MSKLRNFLSGIAISVSPKKKSISSSARCPRPGILDGVLIASRKLRIVCSESARDFSYAQSQAAFDDKGWVYFSHPVSRSRSPRIIPSKSWRILCLEDIRQYGLVKKHNKDSKHLVKFLHYISNASMLYGSRLD